MKLADAKIGEVVTLNSGGVKMVVIDTTASGRVICAWQTATESHVDTFPAESLAVAKTDK